MGGLVHSVDRGEPFCFFQKCVCLSVCVHSAYFLSRSLRAHLWHIPCPGTNPGSHVHLLPPLPGPSLGTSSSFRFPDLFLTVQTQLFMLNSFSNSGLQTDPPSSLGVSWCSSPLISPPPSPSLGTKHEEACCKRAKP